MLVQLAQFQTDLLREAPLRSNTQATEKRPSKCTKPIMLAMKKIMGDPHAQVEHQKEERDEKAQILTNVLHLKLSHANIRAASANKVFLA